MASSIADLTGDGANKGETIDPALESWEPPLAVTAIVVDITVRQAVLRGDGAPVHTRDSAYAKAYTAASLVPVRKETSTKELFERVSKNPSTTEPGAGHPREFPAQQNRELLLRIREKLERRRTFLCTRVGINVDGL